MTSLLNTQYGGTWNAQDGSEPYYVSGDQSFAMGAIQAGQDGWWGSPGAPSSFDQALYNYNGGAITSGMAATLFSVTWGSTGQATNVSAEDTNGGFNISGTAASDGSNFSGYFVSDDFVRGAFENLAEAAGSGGSGAFGGMMFDGDIGNSSFLPIQNVQTFQYGSTERFFPLYSMSHFHGYTQKTGGEHILSTYATYENDKIASVGLGLDFGISSISGNIDIENIGAFIDVGLGSWDITIGVSLMNGRVTRTKNERQVL